MLGPAHKFHIGLALVGVEVVFHRQLLPELPRKVDSRSRTVRTFRWIGAALGRRLFPSLTILLPLLVMETYEILEPDNDARRNCNNCQNMDRLRITAVTWIGATPVTDRMKKTTAVERERLDSLLSLNYTRIPANVDLRTIEHQHHK